MNLKTMFFTSQTALLVRSLRNKHQLLLFPQLVPIFPLYLYCSSSSNYSNFQLPRHPLAIGHGPTGSPFSAAQFEVTKFEESFLFFAMPISLIIALVQNSEIHCPFGAIPPKGAFSGTGLLYHCPGSLYYLGS